MQPQTTLSYRSEALLRLQKKLNITKVCNTERDKDPAYAMEIPQEIGLKLSNRCNLRCTHCFQWNEEGYHNHLGKGELAKAGDLDIEIVKRLLAETSEVKSHLYVWGGEPMIYGYWEEFIELLANDPRQTVICTNGLLIKRELDSLIRISDCLTMLVSIEGLEEIHDKLRGKNTFCKIIDNIQTLIDLQKAGIYKGFISVAGVLSDDLIPELFETCLYFEELGIDTLYFNFPWFIDHQTACDMDRFFNNHFSWMNTDQGAKNSWHSFDFHLNPALRNDLLEQMAKIKERKWDIRIRFQPDLEDSEIQGFIEGSNAPCEKRSRCLSISNRIDLMPNGNVVPCKKFPEFVVGNMKGQSLKSVWHGEDFKKFRTTHNNTLMPICSKCELLYSNGV